MSISSIFEYVKPISIEEALQTFDYFFSEEKKPIYYAGGTEIISSLRANKLDTKALIDIKGITECNILQYKNGHLTIGTAVTLAQLVEWGIFPLLTETLRNLADHTLRNQITLGGSICSQLIYREALLPLLLTDSMVVIAGKNGLKTVKIHDIFHSQFQLDKGEFLVQILIDGEFLNAPYVHYRKTRQAKLDYPLLTVTALNRKSQLRVAFSGISDSPFRSGIIEEFLNNRELSHEERVNHVVNQVSAYLINDFLGTSEFRKFLLGKLLLKTLETLEGTG